MTDQPEDEKPKPRRRATLADLEEILAAATKKHAGRYDLDRLVFPRRHTMTPEEIEEGMNAHAADKDAAEKEEQLRAMENPLPKDGPVSVNTKNTFKDKGRDVE